MRLRKNSSDLSHYIGNLESRYKQGLESLESTINRLNKTETTVKTLLFAGIINWDEFEHLMTTINGTKNNILK